MEISVVNKVYTKRDISVTTLSQNIIPSMQQAELQKERGGHPYATII